MQTVTEIKLAITALVGALSAVWGWMGWLVVGWVVCMAIDYISGSAAAAKAGEWSSSKARDGIWHKAGMVVVVLVSAGADMLLAIVLDDVIRWRFFGEERPRYRVGRWHYEVGGALCHC